MEQAGMLALWGFEKVRRVQRCDENFQPKINPAFYRYRHTAQRQILVLM
jgi:hypothetical protein